MARTVAVDRSVGVRPTQPAIVASTQGVQVARVTHFVLSSKR